MPLEAGALLLDLAGIGDPLWWATGKALDLLLWIARQVAGASGAAAMLAAMPSWAFVAMVIGWLWLCLWTTRLRLFGIVPFLTGTIGAALSSIPNLLITGDGRYCCATAAETSCLA